MQTRAPLERRLLDLQLDGNVLSVRRIYFATFPRVTL